MAPLELAAVRIMLYDFFKPNRRDFAKLSQNRADKLKTKQQFIEGEAVMVVK